MIDFHAHILPGMDDGAKDIDMSLEMLHMLKKQGIETVIATPHYYSDQESIDKFLLRREISYQQLIASNETSTVGFEDELEKLPDILLGAEVEFFLDIAQEARIGELCIENTNCLLLEMPFCSWGYALTETVYHLISAIGITPIIAHVERYLSEKNNTDRLQELVSMGATVQSNASFFISRKTRRYALSLLRQGYINIFGSDCHNVTTRAPNMGNLQKILRKKVGSFEVDRLNTLSASMLKEKPVALFRRD
jgi:protein-tyrosine phosphatase